MSKKVNETEENNGLTEEQIVAQSLAEQAQQKEEEEQEEEESEESEDSDDTTEDSDDETPSDESDEDIFADDEDLYELSTRKVRDDVKSKFKGYALELFPDNDYFVITKNKDANVSVYFRDPEDENRGRLVVASNNVNDLVRDKKLSIEAMLCLPINIVAWKMPKRNDKGETIIDKQTGKPVMVWVKSWRFSSPQASWRKTKDNERRHAMDENEYEELS